MKNFRLFSLPVLSIGLVMFCGLLGSCKKDEVALTKGRVANVAEAMSSNGDLMKAALATANISNELSAAGPFTVFNPVDSAFIKAGFFSGRAISGANPAWLANILKYHVTNSSLMTAKIIAGSIPTLTTGKNLNITVANTIKLNGGGHASNVATVNSVSKDVTLINGVFHSIDRLLFPEPVKLTELIVNNGEFTLLEAALLKANLLATIDGGTFTVFAPTDDAFIAFLGVPAKDAAEKDRPRADLIADAVKALNALDNTMLTGILNYHMLVGNVPAASLTTGEVTTVNGKKLAVKLADKKISVVGTGNNNKAANVNFTNVYSTNGIIQIIDKVLIP